MDVRTFALNRLQISVLVVDEVHMIEARVQLHAFDVVALGDDVVCVVDVKGFRVLKPHLSKILEGASMAVYVARSQEHYASTQFFDSLHHVAEPCRVGLLDEPVAVGAMHEVQCLFLHVHRKTITLGIQFL